MKPLLALSLAISFGVSTPAMAEIYCYQDSSGKWHYSDVKPENGAKFSEVEAQQLNTMSSVDSVKKVVVAVSEELCSSDKQRRSNFYRRGAAAKGAKGTFDLVESNMIVIICPPFLPINFSESHKHLMARLAIRGHGANTPLI